MSQKIITPAGDTCSNNAPEIGVVANPATKSKKIYKDIAIIGDVVVIEEVENYNKILEDFELINDILFPKDIEKLIGKGTDKCAFNTFDPKYILKTTYGLQQTAIPKEISHFFLQFYQFEFPHKICPGSYKDFEDEVLPLHKYGQIQLKCKKPEIKNITLHDEELYNESQRTCMNQEFIKAIKDTYNKQTAINFMQICYDFGLRSVSSANWGWIDNKPVIYDSGEVRR